MERTSFHPCRQLYIDRNASKVGISESLNMEECESKNCIEVVMTPSAQERPNGSYGDFKFHDKHDKGFGYYLLEPWGGTTTFTI